MQRVITAQVRREGHTSDNSIRRHAGEFDREARLAAAAWTDECEEAGPGEVAPDCLQLAASADEGRERLWRSGAHGRKDSGVAADSVLSRIVLPLPRRESPAQERE